MTRNQKLHAQRIIAKEIAKHDLPGDTVFEHRDENVVIFYSHFYDRYVSVQVTVHRKSTRD